MHIVLANATGGGEDVIQRRRSRRLDLHDNAEPATWMVVDVYVERGIEIFLNLINFIPLLSIDPPKGATSCERRICALVSLHWIPFIPKLAVDCQLKFARVAAAVGSVTTG